MVLTDLSVEYRESADRLARRLPQLQKELQSARGPHAFLLQRRIELLRIELGETRRVMAYLSSYYTTGPSARTRGYM